MTYIERKRFIELLRYFREWEASPCLKRELDYAIHFYEGLS